MQPSTIALFGNADGLTPPCHQFHGESDGIIPPVIGRDRVMPGGARTRA